MRLVRAEVLKIVRRRGLMAWTIVLTVGAVLVTEVILVLLHALNPDHHGPAGGQANMSHYLDVLLGLGTIASIMVGSTAGSQDVANGVFRDLVVTGRSRSALFAARAPGVLVALLPMAIAGYAVAVADSIIFVDDLPRAGGHEIALGLEYVLAATIVNALLAVGLAALVSSRIVTGVLIAWAAIVGPLLVAIGSLGGARKVIDSAAIEHFAPDPAGRPDVTLSTFAAIVVLVCWIAVALGVGRWWTERRDA